MIGHEGCGTLQQVVNRSIMALRQFVVCSG
jgi:hypothetical protein